MKKINRNRWAMSHWGIARAAAVLLVTGLMVSACGMSSQQRLQKANTAFNQGHYRTAEIQLKNLLQKASKNAKAWLLLGRVSLATGQYADAIAQLHHARSAGAPAAQVKTPLARALLGNSQYAKVIALLKPDPKNQSTDPDAEQWVLLGEAYTRTQKTQPATQAFAQALQAKPKFAAALVGQARLAEANHHFKYAQQRLDQALKFDPSYAPAQFARGQFAYAKNQCKTAIPALKKAADSPSRALPLNQRFTARAYLADCFIRGGHFEAARPQVAKLMAGVPDNAFVNYLQALLNFRDKDYRQATDHLQQVLKNNPNQANALTLFGLVEIAQNNPRLAEVYLNQAVHQQPLNIKALQVLASLYIQQNQPDRAVSLLQNAHDNHKDNPTITAMLSTALVRNGKAADAVHLMQGSVKTMSAHPGLQFNVARILASAGNTAAATALLDQVKPKDKNGRLQTAHMKVQLALQQKQPNKALTTAKALVAEAPDDAGAKRLLASTYVAVGKPDKAQDVLKKLLAADPRDKVTRLDLGLLALREKNYRHADALFSAVLKQHPQYANAMLGLARSAAMQGHTDTEMHWLRKAHQAVPKADGPALALVRAQLARGQAKQAIPVARQLAAQHPHSAAAQKLAGMVLLTAGNNSKALASFQHAARLAPNDPTYQLDLARAQLAANQAKQAVTTLKALRKKHPDFLAAAPELAVAEVRAGHPKAALAAAHSLSRQANGKAAGAALEGDVLASQQRYQAAIKAYQRAYQANPSAAVAVRLFRARRQAKAAHPAASLADWIARHPNDMRIRLMLAQWQQSQGQLQPAQKQYERVLKAAPGNPIALNNLALLYARQDKGRALVMAKKAYASQPRNPAIMDTLGWLQVQDGHLKSGLPLLQKAAASHASGPDIQYHLAAALAQTGEPRNMTKARTLLQQVLDHDRAFASRAQAQRLSKKLVQKTATAHD